MADSVKVFLSCRHEGTCFAARSTGDRLNERFDKVFKDAENTEPCMDFGDVRKQRANGCETRLAVIGDRWASPKDVAGRRRLDDRRDWVAKEFQLATRRNRALPLLLDRARTPDRNGPPETLATTDEDTRDHGAAEILPGLSKVLLNAGIPC